MFVLLTESKALDRRDAAADERESFQGSLREAREWMRAVRRAQRRSRAASSDPVVEALFDLAAETGWLGALAPSGRVDRGFVKRCAHAGDRWIAALRVEARALKLGEGLQSAGAAGRLALSDVEARAKPKPITGLASELRLYPGEPEEGIRRGEIGIPGTIVVVDARGRLRERGTIPGTQIALGPALSGNDRRLRVAVRGAGRGDGAVRARLGAALALIEAAWPEGAAEVRRRTRLVLTLYEPGLVSYSHLHRIGVTYLNVRDKTVLELADDLVHETAHHRLHLLERAGPLVREHDTDAVRYWSPWRRAQRPVRGILHAAYTFSFRAELFRRIASLPSGSEGGRSTRLTPARIAWVRREAAAEAGNIRRSLTDLEDAGRRGLLTARGRAVVAAISGERP